MFTRYHIPTYHTITQSLKPERLRQKLRLGGIHNNIIKSTPRTRRGR